MGISFQLNVTVEYSKYNDENIAESCSAREELIIETHCNVIQYNTS